MDYLTKADIVLIHNRLIEETGGLHGIRDAGIVASVAAQPQQSVFGKELYPTIPLKAAVYARNIITQHPFLDGNKRTGITAASVFLIDNGHEIRASEGEFFTLARRIAEEKIEYAEIAEWFEKRLDKHS